MNPRPEPPTPTPSWINPPTDLGEVLQLSGVLRLVHEQQPQVRFNLVRRAPATDLLWGHPAIEAIGSPEAVTPVLDLDPRRGEVPEPDLQRPFQFMAKALGLIPPVRETLHLPGPPADVSYWRRFLPFKKWNVAFCVGASSPRLQLPLPLWDELVCRLTAAGVFVVQFGAEGEPYIRRAYSLLGLTTPRETIGLLPCFNLVITVHGFFLHAARLVNVPTIALWGPTDGHAFGYPDNLNFQAAPCTCQLEHCATNAWESMPLTPCPHGSQHCLERIPVAQVFETALALLERSPNLQSLPSMPASILQGSPPTDASQVSD